MLLPPEPCGCVYSIFYPAEDDEPIIRIYHRCKDHVTDEDTTE